jgi:hypothetical protein
MLLQEQSELTKIYNRDGAITTSAVLTEARDPENPLHKHFEWDDSEAAEQHRLAQARNLIKRVRVLVIGNKADRIIHVPSIRVGEREGTYQIASVIARRPNEFLAAWGEARRTLESAIKAVAFLNVLSGSSPTLQEACELLSRAKVIVEEVEPSAAS